MTKLRFASHQRWITGTVWSDRRLRVTFQDIRSSEVGEGSFEPFLPELKMPTPGTLRRDVLLATDKLRPSSTEEYLRLLGRSDLNSCGQVVYETTIRRTRLLFPAQLLIAAMYGSSARMRAALLSPAGPEHLVRPYIENGELSLRSDHLGVRDPIAKLFDRRRLIWVFTYPSARAGWASVFERSGSGVLDLKPPKALLHAAVRGQAARGTLAATKMLIWGVEPTESPFDFAQGYAPGAFVMRPKASVDVPVQPLPPVQDSTLAGLRCVKGGLTDAEWQRVEAALKFDKARANTGMLSRRYMLEAILRKQGLPCTWRDAVRTPAERAVVKGFLNNLRKSGRWQRLHAVLAQFERA